MKITINKSRIMTTAWGIFKSNSVYSASFSMSLRRAWEIEKREIAKARKDAEVAERMAAFEKMLAEKRERNAKAAESVTCNDMAFMAGCADQYSNAARGAYFGD